MTQFRKNITNTLLIFDALIGTSILLGYIWVTGLFIFGLAAGEGFSEIFYLFGMLYLTPAILVRYWLRSLAGATSNLITRGRVIAAAVIPIIPIIIFVLGFSLIGIVTYNFEVVSFAIITLLILSSVSLLLIKFKAFSHLGGVQRTVSVFATFAVPLVTPLTVYAIAYALDSGGLQILNSYAVSIMVAVTCSIITIHDLIQGTWESLSIIRPSNKSL